MISQNPVLQELFIQAVWLSLFFSVFIMIFKLAPSKILFFLRGMVSLFALGSLVLTFSSWLFCAGFCVLILLLLHEKDRPQWTLLTHIKDNEWLLEAHSSERLRVILLPSSVMLRYVLILHMQTVLPRHKKQVVIFSDQLSMENYRALRRVILTYA